MDFRDTPEDAEYRARVRAFLESHAKLETPDSGRGYRDGNDDPAVLETARKWQRIKAEAGFAGIVWPREYGGQGGSQLHHIIYEQEEARFDVPRGNFFYIGLGWAMPTLFATPTRSCAATRSGASCSPSLPAAPTSAPCAPRRCARATSG